MCLRGEGLAMNVLVKKTLSLSSARRKVGAIHMIFGVPAKITPEITPSLAKQPGRVADARSLRMAQARRLQEFAQAT